jgi:hypothetical protein
MATEQSPTSAATDLLVLRDETGAVYALPRPVVEQHRLTEEAADRLFATLRAAAAGDVSGFNQPSGGGGAPTAASFGGGVRGQNLARIAARLDPVGQDAFLFWIGLVSNDVFAGFPSSGGALR